MKNKKDKSNNETYREVLLIVIGAVIGYLCVEVTQSYAQWFALPFFIFDVAIVIVVYYFIRNRYRRLTLGFICDIAENVRRIKDGKEMAAPGDGTFSSEIAELYAEIDALNKSLLSLSVSKDNVIGIINSIALNIELDKLLEDTLPKIIEVTGSNWGAFYLYNPQSEKMELKSSNGFTKSIYKEFDIALGDGFVGQSAQTDKISIFHDIPDDTVYISKTFLGKIKPRSVMTVPIRSEGENVAILLLASIYNYNDKQLEVVNLIRYYLGTAIMNGLTFERTKRLKNELLFQNQLIQNMNEELELKVEERTRFLNDVFNSIVDYAIVSMDEDNHILTWNKGAELIRGLKAEDVIGKYYSETFPDGGKEVSQYFEAAKRDGRYENFGWLTKATGENIYIHRIIITVYSEQGELAGYTVITRNMTSTKLLEDKKAYLVTLCDLLLKNDETRGLIVMNDDGLIFNVNKKAADICNSEIEKLNGVMFEKLLLNGGVFSRKLKAREGDSGEIWQDTLKNGAEIDICISDMTVEPSQEKIAVAYIEKRI